jgi:hypothetical protein
MLLPRRLDRRLLERPAIVVRMHHCIDPDPALNLTMSTLAPNDRGSLHSGNIPEANLFAA